ncbi:MAG: amidohydrolase family protein [Promethearchaeota archaeon]|jgi:predicted TIM-barrel fold metal-dependent hydrolase
MIIDFHCHIWDEELMSEELRAIIVDFARQFRFDENLIMDGTADRLIPEMDEAGIDKSVILGLDYEYLYKGKISYRQYNDKVSSYLDEYPDRLIGLAGIDPRRGKEAIQELERCMSELGFKGVKFWTLTGFYPDDLEYYPFYERVEDLKGAILCHTGMGPSGTYLKYCRPMYIDKIAVDFPKIKFIMAHMGNPWIDEAIAVATKNRNVYLDISGLEPSLKMAPFMFFQNLLQAKMSCGVGKILFGSDWPMFTPILTLKEYVAKIKEMKLPPPIKLMGMPEFTEEEKLKILGDNVIKILS